MFNNDEDDFLRMIAQTPWDDAPRLIYADWLEEQNQPLKSEYMRLVTRLRNDVDEPDALARLMEVATSLPPEWRQRTGNCFALHFDTGESAELLRAVFEAMTFFAPKTASGPEAKKPLESICVGQNLTREDAQRAVGEFSSVQLIRFRMFVRPMAYAPPSP